MRKSFNPFDWYWVKPDGVTLYKSRAQGYVTATDADYKAWSADGSAPTLWPKDMSGVQTDAAMQAVLSDHGLLLPDGNQTAAMLTAYAEAKQAALVAGGYAFNLAAAGQPAEFVRADTDIGGRLNLAGLVSLAQLNPSFTSVWVQAGGGLTLTAAEIVALGVAVGTFVEQTYQALAAVLAGISSGAITTRAQVDAAAWPAASGALTSAPAAASTAPAA